MMLQALSLNHLYPHVTQRKKRDKIRFFYLPLVTMEINCHKALTPFL